jgi:adhesin transport system outer membrane protein
VLFDNGKKKAERDFAAADVEYAAVNLSIDMNTRVHTALSLYNSGLLADEKSTLSQRALTRMREFERIVVGRVEGGVSDHADQRVVEAKIKDMLAAQTTSREAARTARAELAAMTGQQFDDLTGHRTLGVPNRSAGFLTVELAKADANRTVAQATIERAGLLPSLSASASVGTDGGAGLDVGGGGWGFGTADSIRAIEAVRETSGLKIDEADETARRTLSRLEQRLASYQRQEHQSRGLVADSRKTFELFQEQFEAGQRSVMDVANIYEQLVTREQAHLDAKYEIILIQLELARELGVLANGADI